MSTKNGPETLSKRPNILLLMVDQLRPDVLGYAGNEVIRTPNLDRLAEGAVRFSNCYSPSPICVPCRQALHAGQLPKTCGVERYGESLEPGYLTFPQHFAKYAYQTTACGKLHNQGLDQNTGYTRVIGMHGQLEEAYKFDRGYNPPIDPDSWAAARGRHKVPWTHADNFRRAGPGEDPLWRHDEYATIGAELHIDEYFANPYFDRAKFDQPLLLTVSFQMPHDPLFCDEERFSYYLHRVPVFTESPPSHPCLGRIPVEVGKDVSEWEGRRGTAAYYGRMDKCDELFGRVLSKLEAVGQNLDDWIIIFTSDHGEMLGEHGCFTKTTFYESSARVPLFVRWPGNLTPRDVPQNVNLCDLFATLCDLADLSTPEGLDSRTLVPLMSGDDSTWSNETISQMKTFGNDEIMIKQDDLKYQYYGEEIPEVLFDLASDPRENTNVIDRPEHAAVVSAFRKRRSELGFGSEADPDYENAGYCT